MTPDIETRLFAKSLSLRLMLREMIDLVGTGQARTCLELNRGHPVMSSAFRKQGGAWHTVVLSESSRDEVISAVGSNVSVFNGKTLPFEDKTFDVIVITDFLQRIPDSEELIAECHRTTKATGNLVVNVPHAKRWSLLNLLSSALGLTPQKRGWIRHGYTEAELFDLIKHGFDVHTERSHVRFLLHLVDTIVQLRIMRRSAAGQIPDAAVLSIMGRAYPFSWLAYQLDALLLMAKGYYLLACAKRHAWRPRKAPILNDGRRIGEAVLSKIKA